MRCMAPKSRDDLNGWTILRKRARRHYKKKLKIKFALVVERMSQIEYCKKENYANTFLFTQSPLTKSLFELFIDCRISVA